MTDLKVLETERLILTGWRTDQLDDLVALHGDASTARYLSASGAPWTREQAESRLAVWMDEFANHRMGKLRVTRKSDGALVGRAGYSLYPPTGEPEIGYALSPEYRGAGYAREAAEGLRDWLFRETEWTHFIGFADVRNAASLKILRSIGMEPTHVAVDNGMECQFHVLRKAL